MKRKYAADTLKWNLTDLLTKEKDRATLDFLCECVDFLLKQPKPDADIVTIKLPDDGMCAITVNDDDVHSIKADKPRYFIGERELTCDEAWEWIQDAIDTKSKRVPDPDTGLVPCSCGRKATISRNPGFSIYPDLYQVDCFECHVGTNTSTSPDIAIREWNRAMGYKNT